jgi:hypothetical protein
VLARLAGREVLGPPAGRRPGEYLDRTPVQVSVRLAALHPDDDGGGGHRDRYTKVADG